MTLSETEGGIKDGTLRNYGDGISESTLVLRARLNEHNSQQADRYWSRHNVEDLLIDRCDFFDQLIAEIWHQHIPEKANAELGLLAVGGYGRGELFPQSDIDLLIIGRRPHRWAEPISNFLHVLYDLNLEVGHSVRRLNECRQFAKDDITIATAMFERRLLAGSTRLAGKLDKILSSPRLWPIDRFFRAKRDEQLERHKQFDNVDYGLEPNIKSSPGGLRDLQTVMWVFLRQFGTAQPKALEEFGALTQQERVWLEDGRRFLWWVRFGLHLVADRKEDRLQFEYQRNLAERLGFADTDAKLGVERFMNHYYRHVLELREVNDIVLQYFDESTLRSKEKPRLEPINGRFQIRNDYLETTHAGVFTGTPSALLEMFVIMANRRDISGVRAETIRSIRDNLHLINDDFRNDPTNTKLFISLLKAPYTLVSQLTRMRRYGILARYLPEYGEIVGQMQHDLFHIYTVDAHTMMVIRNMRRFHYRSSEAKYPVACHCVRNLPKIELLYIAGLYHDIGKGRGGDHSELGATDVRAFCQRHQIGPEDTDLVAWLVEKHLLMSSTAQRQDIYDPDVILSFACEVKSERRLQYLYALTVADINATNPNLWNDWRASLLRTLFNETRKALRRGLESPLDRDASIRACQSAAREKLLEADIDNDAVDAAWQVPGEEFFLHHTPRQVAEVTLRMIEHEPVEKPLVVLLERRGQIRQESAAELLIYVADKPRLFVGCVSALNQLGLSVVDATIHTASSGLCLNSFIVLEENGDAPSVKRRSELAIQFVRKLADVDSDAEIVSRHVPRQLKQLPTTTEVHLTNSDEFDYSLLTVIAADRPGLLAAIGGIFADLKISVQLARIATLGERVEDVFGIVDQNGAAITDAERVYLLENTIRQRLDSELASLS